MGSLFDRVRRTVTRRKERAREVLRNTRVRWPWFDHLLRTVRRYQSQSGDHLAGAVTYFAFLSFFPIISLAFALFGYVVTFRPDALATLQRAINEQLPGLAERLNLAQIAGARVGAGIIGLLGLLYAGLGAVEGLRVALRQVTMTTAPELDFFKAKLRDLVALALIGLTLVISVAVGGFATATTSTVTSWVGIEDSVGAGWLVRIVGLGVSLGADMLVFVVILGWLAKATQPFKAVLKGALVAAIGQQLLKQFATLLLSTTLGNPVYGTFAVIAGLLIWINLSVRVTLYAAAWTSTSGFGPAPDPTPVPSALGERDEQEKRENHQGTVRPAGNAPSAR